MIDRVFAAQGDWALASDGIQWMLCRRRTRKAGTELYWNPVWFVRSTKDVLAMGMREKGVGAETARFLLSGLPDTFDQWKALQTPQEGLLALSGACP